MFNSKKSEDLINLQCDTSKPLNDVVDWLAHCFVNTSNLGLVFATVRAALDDAVMIAALTCFTCNITSHDQ